ncbi:metal ABC transporter substrate-binding protein [Streptomyces sp. NBC_00687]|uniref:metal ABC transporter substrate-binding protein n=1 Tax=Streptomyces sp. NBC_00687 TaxID=2975807 RepID=UPI0022526212|nr:metal ABC transporter substrate-binding protein [Streptomyces sp. NBC_00687]MCX4914613.1 metal ABC transporter substrate-binding protein [Streptomyces sp. NBC_00687]
MNVRRRLISGSAALVATALGLGVLSACSGSASADGKGGGKLDVVASFYPLQYLAEEIGGSHVSVTNLTQPGQEPHDLEISARQTAQLQEADAVLYLKNLQPAVDDAVAQSEVGTKIDAASLTTLEKHGNEVGGHAAEHDHRAGEEAGAADPHVWLDPVRFGQVAEGVAKGLEKADPQHAGDYARNMGALRKKFDALDKDFRDGLAHTDTKTFITTHAAFGYLAERYGLTEEAINGLDPESEPSAKRVRGLETLAKADGVTTVFYETLVSDKTARTIARDAGLRADVLDPIEGITGKSKGDDYMEVMRSNLKALQTALGAR